ncbi:DUF1453 domain-containing protein [Streptomyces sp. NPDC020379]|uniref:DUF1453 domain-containing protein n=1 Tax=Streptomyces sp. NPDC020379 TaxID=3365071 RepID=UPI0037BC5529
MHSWLLGGIIAVAVVVVVIKRLAGEPLNARDLLAAPVILTGLGVASLAKAEGLTATDGVWSATGAVLGMAAGAWRGSTIAVFEKNGVLWQRYTGRSFLVLVITFAAMAGFGLLATRAGMHESARPTQLNIGVSFLGEALVVGLRGLRSGVPFAPERSRP